MRTFKRICLKEWQAFGINGDNFWVKRGEEVITSADREDGTCTVYKGFWVNVPLECFGGEVVFTES